MFGFSITKLLFTALAIAAVWYGFKWYGRMQELRGAERERLSRQRRQGGGQGEAPGRADAEDMTQCPACGDYVVARGARSCGRGDCPYPG